MEGKKRNLKGLRKFVLASVIIGASLIAILIHGFSDPATYLILGTFGIFTGGNIVEYIKK